MKENILFFLSHQPNPRFIKQINFLTYDYKIFLVYFKREGSVPLLLDSLNKNVNYFEIGTIRNFQVKPKFQDYFKRLTIYRKALGFIRKLNKKHNFNIILGNNIDMLFIYIVSNLGLNF
jgi:succinoglycan biosynthesis protein ExoL